MATYSALSLVISVVAAIAHLAILAAGIALVRGRAQVLVACAAGAFALSWLLSFASGPIGATVGLSGLLVVNGIQTVIGLVQAALIVAAVVVAWRGPAWAGGSGQRPATSGPVTTRYPQAPYSPGPYDPQQPR